MYEFEGLLFTSPEAIAAHLSGDNLMSWAQAVLKQFNIAQEIGIGALCDSCAVFNEWLVSLESLAQ